ncbi:M50 family metallopeptidase [Estrella lausannensis]|uniref:Metallopeptidase n=1 Tax=Estrella lausannensis TaxID=483423 RepID=A0A0H5DS83_9BACT|nr:M50 family metallopeptidase [Estrella lausannensis]CRX39153.1 Metallopeptidase [Estrella lausannensis]
MIPIRISPYFFIIAAVIGWLSTQDFALTLIWIGVIFFSVLFHEFGHAAAGLSFGQKVEIQLTGFGGVTYRSGKALSRMKEFLIVLAGPFFGTVLAFSAYMLLGLVDEKEQPSLYYLLSITAVANLFWTMINLLPTQPLDGGKLLAIPLEAFFGLKGLRISFFFSLIFSVAAGLFFFSINAFLAGVIFFILAFENFISYRNTSSMSDSDQNQELWEELKAAQDLVNRGEVDQAHVRFEDVAKRAGAGVIFVAATEAIASILRYKGKLDESYSMFQKVKEHLSLEHLKILQEVAFKTGHYEEALDAGSRIYRDTPDPNVALFNARSHAKLGDILPACGWLKSALLEGEPGMEKAISESVFDSIRRSPEFQEITRLIEKASKDER